MEKTTLTTWESFAGGAKQFLNNIVFQYVPKLIVACIVLFVGWKLINLLNRFMKRTYDRHKVDASLQQFLHSLIDIILKVLLVLTVMGILGIQMTSFIAILGAAGVAIGMALQGTLQNFAGGVIILLLRPFKVGDYIEQGSYAGYVDNIQIFNTTLRTYDARKIIVPNTELATKSLVNHFNLPQRRVSIDVGLAYGMSVEKAKAVMLRVAARTLWCCRSPPRSPRWRISATAPSTCACTHGPFRRTIGRPSFPLTRASTTLSARRVWKYRSTRWMCI